MSKKSQTQWQQREKYRSPVLALHQQKEHIRFSGQEALNMFCFMLLLGTLVAILVLVIGEQDFEFRNLLLFFCALIYVSIACIYLVTYIQCRRVLRILQNIQYISEESVTIQCQKVSFIYRVISKHSSVIACVCLRDHEGKTYYYVYPEDKARYDCERKSITKQLKGQELQLVLYRGTPAIIKMPWIERSW